MNINLIGRDGVVKTNSVKKVSFGGSTKEFPVYKVSLKHLFYNDKNDRIATWMSKHIEENGDLNKGNIGEYNGIIEDFIVKSNEKRFKKTKQNIKIMSQREPGVILADGRVIDGNRRFTCLRQLFSETESQDFEYFETIIIESDANDKRIKILELDLQHGVDEKVDYNPIDKLVGVYNDIIKYKILTRKEYEQHINVSKREMQLMIDKAEVMADFLDFINAGEKFYIARDLDLDGPLQEIVSIKKKYKKEEEWAEVKARLYAFLYTKPKGDLTRAVRDIGKILKSKQGKEFIEKTEDLVEEVYDIIPEEGTSSKKIKEVLSENKATVSQLSDVFDSYKEKTNVQTIKDKPMKQLENADTNLGGVNFDVLKSIPKEGREAFKKMLLSIKSKVREIEEVLDAE